MNNCPKCGNPLQVGTSSCPICGTNTSSSVAPEQVTNENGKTTVTVASVATPVGGSAQTQAAQPAPAPTPVAPAPTQVVEPQVPTTQPVVQEAAVQKIDAEPTQPAAPVPTPAPQPVAQVAEPTPAVQAPVPATPVTEQVQAVTSTPAPAPQAIEPTAPTTEPVDPNSIAPTIKPIEMATPVPSIPASVNPDVQVVTTTENVKLEKPKKKMNKNVLAIVGILAVVVIVAVLMMSMGGKNKLQTNTNTNPEKNSALNTTAVSSNGFKFNLEEGWVITEDGTNVIVTNKDETVAIKLDYTKSGLDTITQETIEGFFASRTDFTNTTVSKTTISAKDAYLVNTQINQAMVQLYYINGGANLTLGATIVYQSPETKTLYEANVTELIGTLSYSDDTLKAISSMQMYSNIFNAYSGVFQYQPSSEVNDFETPSNEQEQNNEIPNNGTEENPVE